MSSTWSEFIGWATRTTGLAESTLERIMWTLTVIAVYVGLRFITRMIALGIEDIPKRYILKKSSNYVLGFGLFIGILVVWFGNATGWAAYLGILSAGLAIALQDPVTNLAGWIFIAIRKPFAVGDRIEIGEHSGDVIDMRLFQFTLIETGNWVNADQSTGRIIHVPNGWVFRRSTANYTTGFNFIWNELPVTVTFESNWEKAKTILTGVVEKHSILKGEVAQEQIRKTARKYMIYFQYLTPIVWTSVADIGVTLTIRYITEPRRRRSSEQAIWEDVLRAFAEAGDIDFAYPTTRFYNNVSEGKPEARAKQ